MAKKNIEIKKFKSKYTLCILKILAKQNWLKEYASTIKIVDNNDDTSSIIYDVSNWDDIEAADDIESFCCELNGVNRIRHLLKDF